MTLLIIAAAVLMQPGLAQDARAQTEPPPRPAQQGETAALRELLALIARGDEIESSDAVDDLVDRVVDPLVAALGKSADRPVAEQLRLRAALARLTAALRMRLARANLPAEDQQHFDRFASVHEELLYALFDDDELTRQEALQRIPLDPGSGAGVIIAMKVDDWSENVADAALDLALKLRDSRLADGLARYVQGVVEALRSGAYKPADQEVVLTLGVFSGRAIRVLGESGDARYAPVVMDALEFFGKGALWIDGGPFVESFRALARFGDERAAAQLITFFETAALHRAGVRVEGRIATQTVGDVALLAFLQLYGLEPAALGMVRPAQEERAPRDFWGFHDPASRERAFRAARLWHAANAALPRADRAPLTLSAASQPAP